MKPLLKDWNKNEETGAVDESAVTTVITIETLSE